MAGRHQECELGRNLYGPHEFGTRPLQDLHDLAFGLAFLRVDKHPHLVAVQGMQRFVRRDENVFLAFVVFNIGRSGGCHVHRSAHIAIAVLDAELAALRFGYGIAGFQLGEDGADE